MFQLASSETQSPARLRIAVTSDESGFRALRDDWNALAVGPEDGRLFLTHDWFEAAWAWRQRDGELRILCARDGDRLVGVLPLLASRNVQGRVELLTVPDTQFCDLIVDPRRLDAVVAAFVHAFATMLGRWHELRLAYLAPQARILTHLLPALRRAGYPAQQAQASRNLHIPLDVPWNQYYDTRTRSLKKANNLALNRLKKAGAIAIDVFGPEAAGAAGLETTLDTIVALSAESWKRDTGNSLDQPGPQAFIRTLSARALERGWLAVWTLRLDDRPLAMEYQLVDQGNVYALRADFSANCVELSPGSHLSHVLLQRHADSGRRRRYFMGPGENAYKLRWSSEGVPVIEAVVYNRTIRGRTLWLRETVVKPKLRALRDRWAARRAARPDTDATQEQDKESH